VRLLRDPILLVHAAAQPCPELQAALKARYAVSSCPLEKLSPDAAGKRSLLVVDAPLNLEHQAQKLRKALAQLTNRLVRRVFVVEENNRVLAVRANACGAEAVLPRPLTRDALYRTIDRVLHDPVTDTRDAGGAGLKAGVSALEDILHFATSGFELTQDELYTHGDEIIEAIAEIGLSEWAELVKRHHSRTFRHSLLVTGVAVGFGQLLGVGHLDLRRLALGSLLHDVGKAEIPVGILEKPGSLTPEETEAMRHHPGLGRAILQRKGGFSAEMIDVVAHHHEMLDGSGYPDKLMANQITDLVRAVTISDIFAALIEERAYKSRLSATEAYDLMCGMTGKLDPVLLREFAHVIMRTPLAV
jgi:putative nucleotidyltransferase with HDIG domain